MADACVVHGCSWLIDKCRCGAPLSRHRRMIFACDRCARSLASVKTSAAPAALVGDVASPVPSGGRRKIRGEQRNVSLTRPPPEWRDVQFHELHLLYRMGSGRPVIPFVRPG